MIRRSLAAALLTLVALTGCSPAGESAPQPPAAPEAAPPVTFVEPAPIDPPVRIDIPALGVTAPVEPVGLDAQRRMEIPDVHEVGWYELSVLPGAAGPAVLAGHRNWDGVDGAFVRIADLRPGDDIVLTDADGDTAVFDVYDSRSFPKAEFDYGFVFADRDTPDLLLVTCSGDVVDRHYADNTAVAARLVAG